MENQLKLSIESLQQFLLTDGEPNLRLYPNWLANRLNVSEYDLLTTLAFAVKDGLVELHWETFCLKCGRFAEHFGSLEKAHSQIECKNCQIDFELNLDQNVKVTFSASEKIERLRESESLTMPVDEKNFPMTNGLDLLLIPSFRRLFADEAPAENESLRIKRVTIFFSDLQSSTAIYSELGDPKAYRIVRSHFDVLSRVIERNRGAIIKTIGDSVMATFATESEAVQAGLEAQKALNENAQMIGDKLVLKVGIHAGTCLAVNLNERLDFFGAAVNTAARLLGASRGGDIVISEEIYLEAGKTNPPWKIIETIETQFKGLANPLKVWRISAI